MTDFEKKEYKNLLTDYINASEKIKQLEKFIKWVKEEFKKTENQVNSKDGSFSNIVELSLLQETLDKLKELGLYKEKE